MHRGVVILGDPGSGKTTLLRYQALHAARMEGQIGSLPTRLPIFVPLAAYDDYTQRIAAQCTLGDFLAIYYDKWHSLPGLAPLFHRALEEGRAVVLLDGLDEVLDAVKRQFVSAQVEGFMRQWAIAGNRFAITSRIVGYREARVPSELPHVTVLDFGRDEIALFAQQWCRAYEVWVAGGETPMRRHVGKLPDRRIDLYASYVRTLIDNWQMTRSRGARQQMPARFDPHTAIAFLIELAFWLQQHKPGGTARRQELEEELENICLRFEGRDPASASRKEQVLAQQTAEHFLRDMRHFAGLLAERGRDAFGFLHLTFQEYFAGRALARMKPDQRWTAIAPNLHRQRWREPILLCAGQLGVLEQRRDEVSDLAQRLLAAQSTHEDILHRDLFLVAALAADDVDLSNTLLDVLAERLQLLQASNIPTVRDMALAGLAQSDTPGKAGGLMSGAASKAVGRCEGCYPITSSKTVLGRLPAPVREYMRARAPAQNRPSRRHRRVPRSVHPSSCAPGP
jgi:predicted NACHT family NTPase